MKPHKPISMAIPAAGFIALLALVSAWAQSNSHARIVRLGFVEGHVTVWRPDVQTWAEAPVNTPLQEGFELSTGRKSFAEIQFENGSTIRLGEFASLDITQLELAPNGGKINQVELHQGYATFHPVPSRAGDSLQVGTPYGTLNAQGGTQFRVDLGQGLARLEVFSGGVEVQSALGAMTIKKGFLLVLQPGAKEPTIVSQNISKDDWDQWVENREAQVEMPSTGPSLNAYTGDNSEAAYGWADLQQFGTWSEVPDAGYGWTPTSVTSDWAPYSVGEWCWYTGWGYTWIGAEPWGWLPYHYGGWEFILGRGWVWFPNAINIWSPSLVTWYRGPNWIGWIPRPHGHDKAIACGDHCGGGAVSTSTFIHGGRLTSHLTLPLNPTTGERVEQPGISPSTAAKLTGRVVSSPLALSQGVRRTPTQSPAAPGTSTRVKTWPTDLGSKSAIVYDPSQGGFVASNHVRKPQGSPDKPAAVTGTTTQSAKAGRGQPGSATSRAPSGRPAQNPGWSPPTPVVSRSPRERPVQTPAPARSNPLTSSSYTAAVPLTSGFVTPHPVTPSSGIARIGNPGSSWAKQGPSGGRVGGAPGGGAHNKKN